MNTFHPTTGFLQMRAAEENNQLLVSRSQAQVLLARMDEYTTIILDFKGVDMVGPAFADQIFRIYAREHPDVVLKAENAGRDVQRMINMAKQALEKERLIS